jgi:hypothetical protein
MSPIFSGCCERYGKNLNCRKIFLVKDMVDDVELPKKAIAKNRIQNEIIVMKVYQLPWIICAGKENIQLNQ